MLRYDSLVVADSVHGRHAVDLLSLSGEVADLLVVPGVFNVLADPNHPAHDGVMSFIKLYLNLHGQRSIKLWYPDRGNLPDAVCHTQEVFRNGLPDVNVALHSYPQGELRTQGKATGSLRCGDGGSWKNCWNRWTNHPFFDRTVFPIFVPGGGHALIHGDNRTHVVHVTSFEQLDIHRVVVGTHHNCGAYGTLPGQDHETFHQSDSQRIAAEIRNLLPALREENIITSFCNEEGKVLFYHERERIAA